jgi:hypothetical protein
MQDIMLELKPDFRQECNDNGLNLDGWQVFYFNSHNKDFINKYGYFYIIKKTLSEDQSLPTMVAMAGFSVKSFCGTTNRIIENFDKIQSKFKDIYVLCFTEQVRDMQKQACKERDDLKAANNKEIYKPEIDLNELLGSIVDKLLRSINLTNVHVLAKCAGAGVGIHTFTKSDIYDALYLGVPASPKDVQHLLTKESNNKKFIFAWDKRDAYKFLWGLSNSEIEKYRKTMKPLEKNNIVKIEMYGDDTPPHDKNFHEVPHELFDLL